MRRANNHTVTTNERYLRRIANSNPNLIYLNGINTYKKDNVLFIGANGWYDWKAYPLHSRDMQLNSWKSSMNDRYVRYGKNRFPDKLGRYQSTMLANHVRAAQSDSTIEHIVVVTHTVPLPELLVPISHPWAYLNGSYCNTTMSKIIDADVAHKIDTWVYGHTHFHEDIDKGHIRFVCNARGYYAPRENGYTGVKELGVKSPNPLRQ